MKEWLENIRQGDVVILQSGDIRSIARVERTTATQVIAGGKRFNKNRGRLVGGDSLFRSTSIHEATPEVVAIVSEQMKRRKIINRLESIRWKDVQTDILEKIAELINVKGEIK